VCGVPLRPVINPTGRKLFVSCRASNTLAIIDTRREALARLIKVGGQPAPPTLAPGGKAFVPLETDGRVAVVRTKRGTVIDRIAVGDAPTTATLNRTGRLLFVPNTASASVSVINVARSQVIRTISTQPRPIQVLAGRDPLVITESGYVQSLASPQPAPPEQGGARPGAPD